MEKHVHIVTFDVPWPVDYGGVVDVFHTIKAFHEAGIHVHLHCYEYGRGEQPELEKYCTCVKYYQRATGHKCVSLELPYIVASRSAPELTEALLEDNYPILLEGVHSTYILNDKRFEGRRMVVRMSNTEYIYYDQLCKSTSTLSLFKKLYYHRESLLLRRYEKHIAGKAMFVAVTEEDMNRYKQEFGVEKIICVPPLLPYTEVTSKTGIGCFCLYHGNLSVPENEKAALWLIQEVFNDLTIPLVIAGKNPTRRLERVARNHNCTCVVANPSEQEMQDMIGKAQINVLPSFNSTGMKLKLLNALYNGRHCLVNDATVSGTGLESACHIGANAAGFKSIIIQLYHQPFNDEEIRLREKMLAVNFNTARNAERIMKLLW